MSLSKKKFSFAIITNILILWDGRLCWMVKKWPNWNRNSFIIIFQDFHHTTFIGSHEFFFIYPDKKIHRFLIHDLTHSTFYTTLCFLCKIDWRNSSYIITQHQKPNNWWFMSPKGQNHDEERKYKNWKEKRALLKNQADISYLLVY